MSNSAPAQPPASLDKPKVAPPAEHKTTWQYAQPFVFGAIAASFSTACVQPVDFLKVRLQLSGELSSKAITNPFTMISKIVKEEGPLAFYKGLGAAIFRQCTYGTVRLGLFRSFSDYMKEPGKPTPAYVSALGGILAGVGGSMVGTPSDVVLVRMQSDATLPVHQRRNYKNILDAFVRMSKEEGFLSLWKGNMPNIYRNVAMSVGMLASYDQVKQRLRQFMEPGFAHNFASSFSAGFIASVVSLPFDFVKTRLQKQVPGPDGQMPYKGFFDCFQKCARAEGLLSFYKGFAVFAVRVGPHAMITLLTLEALNDFAKKMHWS